MFAGVEYALGAEGADAGDAEELPFIGPVGVDREKFGVAPGPDKLGVVVKG